MVACNVEKSLVVVVVFGIVVVIVIRVIDGGNSARMDAGFGDDAVGVLQTSTRDSVSVMYMSMSMGRSLMRTKDEVFAFVVAVELIVIFCVLERDAFVEPALTTAKRTLS
jgi:hypothetical protein